MLRCFLKLVFICFLSSAIPALALENSLQLENKLLEKNQDYLSLEKQLAANEALAHSSYSGYYPTLNLVGGLGQNRTDDLPVQEKGYIAYAEGRFNLFRGFKDQAFGQRKKLQLDIVTLELESKKRQLRAELTDVFSTMIYLHQLENILVEEFKTTQSQKQMASKKVSAGLTGSVDNLEFELKESEIEIEQKQIQQQHFEAHQNIIRLFGEDIADSELDKIDFSSVEKLTTVHQTADVEKSLDFRKAQLLQNESELDRKDIRSDFLPSLDLTYGVGRITPSETNPIQFNESKYALLVTVPLFSGFDSYYKVKAAALTSTAAERTKNQKRNDLATSLQIINSKSGQLKSLLEINEKRLDQSKRYFDLTLSEYKRGIKNSPDLVTATDRLYASKKKKVEILKDMEILQARTFNYR